MKKNRPGHLLTVILPTHLLRDISEIIFRETNTIGLRYYNLDRLKLDRVLKKVKTKYGRVDVKISGIDRHIYKASPEYESCRKIAKGKRVSLSKIYEEAKKVALSSLLLLMVFSSLSSADTVYLKDGSQVKGIIVEDYSDRVVISTEYGEASIEKDEIKNIKFDLLEQNLVAMGNKYREKKDFAKAYFYYDKARKLNPDFKEAQDGANYLEGYLFRKELGKKAEEVKWRQEVEEFGRKKEAASKDTLLKLRELVGIEIADTGKDIKITRVYRNSPAKKAGLREGDIIAGIWGRLTGYLSKEEIATILSKPEHLELKMEIDRVIKIKPRSLTRSNLKYEFEGLKIANLKERSLAYRTGLRDNDLILSIDNESIRYTPLNEVVKILSEGAKTLVIRREVAIWRTK